MTPTPPSSETMTPVYIDKVLDRLDKNAAGERCFIYQTCEQAAAVIRYLSAERREREGYWWPQASTKEQESGWQWDFMWLQSIQTEYENSTGSRPELEEIEDFLRALKNVSLLGAEA